ncbi:hypothetical protein UYO06_22325, partial [Escherichia coli]|nr:hypothetical protein [Escherichia coli]
GPKTSIICSPMTSLKTSIKTITYLSDIGCLEIQGASLVTGSTDNTGYYKNEGTAENIQIELRDDQDAALKNGDSKTVIVDEITRNAQFPLKARAITVNGNASQGTIEALINVIYTWQ